MASCEQYPNDSSAVAMIKTSKYVKKKEALAANAHTNVKYYKYTCVHLYFFALILFFCMQMYNIFHLSFLFFILFVYIHTN